MNLKTITKLYSIFILSFFFIFASCVNNGDEPKPTPPSDRDPVPLDKENLVGTWEVYYFQKRIIDDKTGRDTNYRFPEKDGFTITFNEDGTYQEKNLFGDPVRNASGTYSFGKSDDKLGRYDQILLKHYVDTLERDVVDIAYTPFLFEESFVFYLSYTGTVGKEGYKVNDAYYYRNKNKHPDYVDSGISKKQLKEEDIKNTLWEFHRFDLFVNNDPLIYALLNDDGTISSNNSGLKDKAEELGQRYLFRVENDSLIFYEYLKGSELTDANKRGFTIVKDDIINMRWEGKKYERDKGGNIIGEKWVVESYAWWVKDIVTNKDGLKEIHDYNKYRDIKDVLKIKEETAYYREVKDPITFSSGMRSVDGSTMSKIRVREIAE